QQSWSAFSYGLMISSIQKCDEGGTFANLSQVQSGNIVASYWANTPFTSASSPSVCQSCASHLRFEARPRAPARGCFGDTQCRIAPRIRRRAAEENRGALGCAGTCGSQRKSHHG